MSTQHPIPRPNTLSCQFYYWTPIENIPGELPRPPLYREAQAISQASYRPNKLQNPSAALRLHQLWLQGAAAQPRRLPPLLFELGFWAVAFFGSLAITVTLKRLPLFKEIL